MSTSTDATVFYGYIWSDELKLFGDEEWTTIILEKRGHQNPWQSYPDYSQLSWAESVPLREKWISEHGTEIDAWHNLQKQIEEEFGCDVGYHCSGSYAIPYVYLKKKHWRAVRGYPIVLHPENFVIENEDWRLDKFMKELNIEKPHEYPNWWLCSYWGV